MGRVSYPTPPVKSISQVGLLIMLVPFFFLIFFASCIHVETRPNVGSMNVNMNDVDMNIAEESGNGFDGINSERYLLRLCQRQNFDRRESADPETPQAERIESKAELGTLWDISSVMQFGPLPGAGGRRPPGRGSPISSVIASICRRYLGRQKGRKGASEWHW